MDDIITRLLAGKGGRKVQLTEGEICDICAKAKEIFTGEHSLLEVETPVKICGDIHGQFSDLIRVFEIGGYPPVSNYLFLGNYVGYGKQSIETLFLLLAYKIKYPNKVFLLRGKHEFDLKHYDFYDEFKRRLNFKLQRVINDCFYYLPFAAIIQDKIFCVNGGLSPVLKDLDQIRNIECCRTLSFNRNNYWDSVSDSSLESDDIRDLLWPDSMPIFGSNRVDNERGDIVYEKDIVVPKFLDKHGLYLICRSNWFVEDGYKFFAHRRLVTIFSASNFRGQHNNSSAMLSVDESLMCSLTIVQQYAKQIKKRSSNMTWSPGLPEHMGIPEAPFFDESLLDLSGILKTFNAKQKQEESSNSTLKTRARPCRTEPEALPCENLPKESKPGKPAPFDAPGKNGSSNVTWSPGLPQHMGIPEAPFFDESVLGSSGILKTFNAKQKQEESSNSTLKTRAWPCRTEPEALPCENLPKESKPGKPAPFDAPDSSGAFNVLDSRMSFDDAVLCSFQIFKPFDKKRNAIVRNSLQEPEPLLPLSPRIRKAQKQ